MDSSSFIYNFASGVIICLALFSFYLMLKKQGQYIDIVFGFILAIMALLKILN